MVRKLPTFRNKDTSGDILVETMLAVKEEKSNVIAYIDGAQNKECGPDADGDDGPDDREEESEPYDSVLKPEHNGECPREKQGAP